MEKVKTGDTLCDARKVVALKELPFAEPCYSVAIVPKTRGQEDKIAQGLARMNEEDPTFSVTNNAETHQMVLNGSGDMQGGCAGQQAEEPLQCGGGSEARAGALSGEDP